MRNISDYFVHLELIIIGLLFFALLAKTVLYFSFEKSWDSLKFFHYSKIDLKMTTARHLRTWRKRQNILSAIFGILLILFTLLYSFHQMVSID